MIPLNLQGDEAFVEGVPVALNDKKMTADGPFFVAKNVKVESGDRFKIRKGQFLGLVENKIACVTDDSIGCVKQLIRGMTGASFVTVFYGEGISEDTANTVANMISEKVGGGCEVAVLNGGQPLYDYIISVE